MLRMDRKSQEYKNYQIEAEDTWLFVLDAEGIIRFKDSGKDIDYSMAFDTAKALLEAQEN